MSGRRRWTGTLVVAALALPIAAARGAEQAPRPSLFRGVVVADSPLGVRVVSVEESSQAYRADLRPEDIIVRVDDREVPGIDQFAALSASLRGQAVAAAVLVFRNGAPKQLALHLYSYPVLEEWGVEFIPQHDLRFAEPGVGLAYWARMGRGFEEAGKPAEALDAYLNGLHQKPDDVSVALAASRLYGRLSREHAERAELPHGIAALRDSVAILERSFHYPLTDAQLTVVKHQLTVTLETLRSMRAAAPLNDRRTSSILSLNVSLATS
jgi:hypothetical protein